MHRRKAPLRHFLLVCFLWLGGFGFLIAGVMFFTIALTPIPDIQSFATRDVDQSTKIYDRSGQILLFDYNRDAKRQVVPLASMSPHIIQATIAIEDAHFYSHNGVRPTSFFRALIANVTNRSLSQGGSTITQQVVKNTLLTSRKSVVRKIHEWVLALKLEQSYSKDQILETYLNTVPYGGILYGIEAASDAYFSVHSKELSLSQSAYLAAILQAPSYYSPYGRNRDKLDERKNLVLSRMYELGFIDESSLMAATVEDVSFSERGRGTIRAPHFVFYIIDQLEEEYGKEFLTSGLRIITTIDAELQEKTEAIVKAYALENEEKFGASNASLVALDPGTGQILSMVGSRDFLDPAIDGQYNATLALRQPGSTMKPFIYAAALLRGYTRNTIIFDVPTQFSSSCAPSDIENNTPPCYAPSNYDDAFRGPMTLETALAQSINIPAVKTLYLVGIQQAINFAKSFGLNTLGDPDTYGLTLVLGGGEVRLLDLVGAYGAFANGGVFNAPTGILEIVNQQGDALSSYAGHPRRVLDETISNDVSAMLSNAYARLPEYPLNSPLSFSGYDVAVKTGTTDDTRDAWVVGYTPSIALGVWVGNNDNSPMVKSVAGFIAAPLWHEAMASALLKYPKKYFGQTTLIPPTLPETLLGRLYPSSEPAFVPHSLLYWTDKTNPRGGKKEAPSEDSQFDAWEYGVSYWYAHRPDLFIQPPLFGAVSPTAPAIDSLER
jgi:penicillin-binding protein 1C